jgi:hypothetical protein
MAAPVLSGSEFKKQLHDGNPKMGLFINSHSPTVAEQLAYSGYDWLLVDTQHGPMHNEKLSAMLSAGGELHEVSNGGDALGLFSAAQHEQGRAARLCGEL